VLDLLTQYYPMIAKGTAYTLLITASSLALGFALALTLTIARFIAPAPVRLAAQAYINFFRGTPLLVQLLFVFFALPSLGLNLTALESAIIAIGLNSAAYQAEILRVAIKQIPEEQLLVARSLGLTETQIMTHVVLPQAVRASIPGLSNETVILLKESSLASIIGVMELTRVGEYMISSTFRALESLTIIAIVYLALSTIAIKLLKNVEKKGAIPGYERWI